MRNLILVTSILITQISFSQDIVRQEIFSFTSSERNSKNVKVFLVESKEKTSLIFEAYNMKNMNIQSCSWKTKLPLKSVLSLLEELSSAMSLVEKSSNRFKWFNKDYIIESKRSSKIKIIFLESRCKREHTVGLFQKNCNKKFSIVFEKNKASNFIESIFRIFNNNSIL